jgi:hypothetical protein
MRFMALKPMRVVVEALIGLALILTVAWAVWHYTESGAVNAIAPGPVSISPRREAAEECAVFGVDQSPRPAPPEPAPPDPAPPEPAPPEPAAAPEPGGTEKTRQASLPDVTPAPTEPLEPANLDPPMGIVEPLPPPAIVTTGYTEALPGRAGLGVVPAYPDVPVPPVPVPPGLFSGQTDVPLGFTGPSGVLPRELQSDPHFVPVEDRWRIGFPEWDRYGKGHPPVDDYPYVLGSRWDQFNLNVLKGDYPIIGQNTFLEITAQSSSLFEYHQVPIPTTPFESTETPRSYPFFGRPNQFLYLQYFALSFDLFHGDAAFKPNDWRIKITPIFNINYLAGEELAVVSPDVRDGVDRGRTFMALQEWFVETKLADLGPNYDFLSIRAGSQPFTSDFRGFLFSDTNRAVRLFGNFDSNREQFNLIFFLQQEKDTNSGLNTFDNRGQRILIGNVFIQDFVFPGYTAEFSVHYNHDDPTLKYDQNGFLVRPDPVGVFQPHTLDVGYVGWAGDGHIDRINVNHEFFWAFGHDSLNPLANRAEDISAGMAAVELSYDRDWVRFRTSFLWASGDRNPTNGHATGFDGIFDNPQFAGGEFSYWQRQAIRLLGVNLTNRGSLFADLRSSKIQGQSNFVNPGVLLLNFGSDVDITPKLRLVGNVNCLWFDNTESLQLLLFQEKIRRGIGTDISLGFEYRPLLSNNIIMKLGLATLLPGDGFRDIYGKIDNDVSPMYAAFCEAVLTY